MITVDHEPPGGALPFVDAEAPAVRLAAYRMVFCGFVAAYLLGRLPHFVALVDRDPVDFSPVGVLTLLDRPPAGWIVIATIAATVGAAVASCVGLRWRVAGPLMALGVLFLSTLRSSWGQLLHFEHLIVLHALVLSVTPASDAWSLDARHERAAASPPGSRYGWPISMLCVVTVITYVIAGVAKLRYGGLDWLSSTTLRNHIAYTATRAELLGGQAAPLAEIAVRFSRILTPFAVVTVALELAAPIALLGGRWRNGWVAAVWGMHVGIAGAMWIGFPLALFGIAFAPMFPIERPLAWLGHRTTGLLRRLAGVADRGNPPEVAERFRVEDDAWYR